MVVVSVLGGTLLGAACVHEHRGLVRLGDAGAVLEDSSGRQLPIREEGEGRLLSGLAGCEVQIDARGRRRLEVLHWDVLAGPDGGQPFVGRLSLGDGTWVIDDRSTGGVVSLQLDGAAELAEHAGELVVVTGYVIGPQRVQVVWWSALGVPPEEAGAQRTGTRPGG